MPKKSNNSNLVRARIPDASLWKEFLEFVEDKHKTKYVTTGLELDKCLRLYLGMNNWKNFGKELEDEILNENPKSQTHNARKKVFEKKMDAADKL